MKHPVISPIAPVRDRLYSLTPEILVRLEELSPEAYRLLTKDLPAMFDIVNVVYAKGGACDIRRLVDSRFSPRPDPMDLIETAIEQSVISRAMPAWGEEVWQDGRIQNGEIV